MTNLATEIMRVLLDLVHESYADLPRDDRSRLELVEIRPKSGKFSRVKLSCSISPNDPADPDSWLDEEITSPGKEYNAYSATQFIEMGLGQYYNFRYTIDFTFFFMNAKMSREESLEVAQLILVRIHQAVLQAGERVGGAFGVLHKSDDFGFKLVRGGNAVKKRQLRPGGSDKKPLYRGKMWLQFETYIESIKT